MVSRGKRPAVRAEQHAWVRLGELLQRRRAQLGYGTRAGFARARGVSIRRIGDIENAPPGRLNTWQIPTLQEIAQFYEVTYDSMMDVLREKAGELVPAPAAASRGLLDADLGPAPMTDDARAAAARPHADAIWQRLLDLAASGVTDPAGAQLFGEGSPDARTWDDPNLRRTFTVAQMVWLLADIRRADAERDAGRNGSGVAGA